MKANQSYIKAVFLLILLVGGAYSRLKLIDQEGGDQETYKQAVLEFAQGINPYEYTVQSYTIKTLDHGYAYLPTLLYIQTGFYKLNEILHLDIPMRILWKIPVLIADFGIFFLLSKFFYNKKFLYLAGSLLFWIYNPYFFIHEQYTNYETLPVFFLLLGLLKLYENQKVEETEKTEVANPKNISNTQQKKETQDHGAQNDKNEKIAAYSFALAVAFKTFPILLLPIFFFTLRSKVKFIVRGIFVALVIAFPFMTSLHDFTLMLRGAVFVHGERGIQGRPILSFITYYLQNWGLSFYQAEYSNYYTYVALFGSMLVITYLLLKKRQQNVLILSAISFLIYMLFTPVLNRTHIIWFIPFFILGLYEYLKNKNQLLYIGTLGIIYFVMCMYSYIWLKGFKQPDYYGGKIWMEDAEYIYEPEPNLGTRVYNKIFHIMKWERYPGRIP